MDGAGMRRWVNEAVRELTADGTRSADTHMLRFPLPAAWGIDLYVKDESSHPTGSLKHRLAKSLFLYGLVGGRITEGTTVVEASSGSTAVSEAYVAKLLGLDFVAVMPTSTSRRKIELIESFGGRCHTVDRPDGISAEAVHLAQECGGYYLDQFSLASVATDWRGNNNIACSIFEQLRDERHPVPAWIVVGAGTGGTSATVARYCRYTRVDTRVAVGDPQGSVYYEAWRTGRRDLRGPGSFIEGIGRPQVEPSFLPEVVDEVLPVLDEASIAAMHLVHRTLGIAPGPSTGTNLVTALHVVAGMLARGETGSVVTLLCDRGERYQHTHYNAGWVRARGLDVEGATERLEDLLRTGRSVGLLDEARRAHSGKDSDRSVVL